MSVISLYLVMVPAHVIKRNFFSCLGSVKGSGSQDPTFLWLRVFPFLEVAKTSTITYRSISNRTVIANTL